jgi:SAM-dependent methyltransferase
MLTYPTTAHRTFAATYRSWIETNLTGFHGPSGAPPPGERLVLRNFSREWLDFEWSGKAYWSQVPEDVLTAKRFELGLEEHPLPHRLALELGIGIGGAAHALSRSEGWEVVGVDLSYAVDMAVKHFGANPLLHVVQASVFALPFADACFDVVYSHGVIHHTHSAREAFARLARLPKRAGGMLYVWVYSTEQEKATGLRRVLMAFERAVRPILARLPSALQTLLLAPAIPLYMAFQNVYRRGIRGEKRLARYGLREALHAARDRLTPLFASRHTYAEVEEWFGEAGFGRTAELRQAPLPAGVEPTYVMNVGVRGFRG